MADKSDLYKQIKIQVEYYFGDENYLKDKFLRAQAAQNEKGCKFKINHTFRQILSQSFI